MKLRYKKLKKLLITMRDLLAIATSLYGLCEAISKGVLHPLTP
jgi:hypothetical protein